MASSLRIIGLAAYNAYTDDNVVTAEKGRSSLVAESTSLGEFEQLVLLAILRASPEATAIRVRSELRQGGRAVSRGALYKTLERLEGKGLVTWQVSDSTPERGGIPRRRFEVTADGVATLRYTRETLLRFWSGLEGRLG